MWREAENLADDFAEAYRQGYIDRDNEIVHCKDCKLVTYTVKNQKTHETFYACPYSSIHNEGKSFCSYGERIEE